MKWNEENMKGESLFGYDFFIKIFLKFKMQCSGVKPVFHLLASVSYFTNDFMDMKN